MNTLGVRASLRTEPDRRASRRSLDYCSRRRGADRVSMENFRTLSGIALTLVMLLVSAILTGCTSPNGHRFESQNRAHERTIASPPDHERAFRNGDYRDAARLASQTPRRDERARLIEGMARAELGETERSMALLRPLLRSSDDPIRGRAAATLGLIEQSRGNAAESSRLLEIAADLLTGSDSDWAARYAAQSRDSRPGAAASRPIAANAAAALGDYEIQFGSFSTQARAQRHAQAVTRLTRTTGLDAPRVESVQRGGRTLYAVRAGSFGTRSAAVDVASRLNTDTAIVRTN